MWACSKGRSHLNLWLLIDWTYKWSDQSTAFTWTSFWCWFFKPLVHSNFWKRYFFIIPILPVNIDLSILSSCLYSHFTITKKNNEKLQENENYYRVLLFFILMEKNKIQYCWPLTTYNYLFKYFDGLFYFSMSLINCLLRTQLFISTTVRPTCQWKCKTNQLLA